MTCALGLAYDFRCAPAGARHAVCEDDGVAVSEVYVGDSESIDSALKRFNKRVQAEGILTEARRHEYYEKPSERRKKKEAARRRKMREAIRAAERRATRR